MSLSIRSAGPLAWVGCICDFLKNGIKKWFRGTSVFLCSFILVWMIEQQKLQSFQRLQVFNFSYLVCLTLRYTCRWLHGHVLFKMSTSFSEDCLHLFLFKYLLSSAIISIFNLKNGSNATCMVVADNNDPTLYWLTQLAILGSFSSNFTVLIHSHVSLLILAACSLFNEGALAAKEKDRSRHRSKRN